MRRIAFAILAASAFSSITYAADIARPVYKASVVVPDLKFTGCYVGGNIGYGWGSSEWHSPTFGSIASHSTDGVVGGGQVGCDYQVDRWVFGIQGMFNGTGLKADSVNAVSSALVDSARIPWLATATGRIGITGSPTLYYVKGGAAWVRTEYSECCLAILPPAPPPNIVIPDGFANKTRTGWTLGGGIEHIFVEHWSVFVEYNYIKLSDSSVAFTGINGWSNFNYNIDQNIHSVLLGVNYRF
ncbi:MAG: outer membrane beta-barrel protein [Pseudorhodoplanes sp.]